MKIFMIEKKFEITIERFFQMFRKLRTKYYPKFIEMYNNNST